MFLGMVYLFEDSYTILTIELLGGILLGSHIVASYSGRCTSRLRPIPLVRKINCTTLHIVASDALSLHLIYGDVCVVDIFGWRKRTFIVDSLCGACSSVLIKRCDVHAFTRPVAIDVALLIWIVDHSVLSLS